jgi:hypothetical protein
MYTCLSISAKLYNHHHQSWWIWIIYDPGMGDTFDVSG